MFVQYVNWVGISIQKFKDNQGTLNVILLDLGAANDEKFEKYCLDTVYNLDGVFFFAPYFEKNNIFLHNLESIIENTRVMCLRLSI